MWNIFFQGYVNISRNFEYYIFKIEEGKKIMFSEIKWKTNQFQKAWLFLLLAFTSLKLTATSWKITLHWKPSFEILCSGPGFNVLLIRKVYVLVSNRLEFLLSSKFVLGKPESAIYDASFTFDLFSLCFLITFIPPKLAFVHWHL